MKNGNTASDQTYMRIAENIDRGFQTAPKVDGGISKAFLGFLKIVYSPQEAELVQHLDMYLPKTAEELATITGKDAEVIQERSNLKSILLRYRQAG